MIAKELYNEMVVVRRNIGGTTRESVWYLSDLSDDLMLFLIDAHGDRWRPFEADVAVRKATELEIAESAMREIGLGGKLNEIEDEEKRNELILAMANQTRDLCKKEAAKWSRG